MQSEINFFITQKKFNRLIIFDDVDIGTVLF